MYMNETQIPEAFQQMWLDVSEELSVATAELNRANERYQAAIRGRLALLAVMRGEQP